ncbi:uncharacterized protein A4U43_C06F10390 [Asparagus officinalis]|uniref:Uncharacterized protein n=1 Tax=Asparagus officinalis TaxID=4686 RepID=A0A5P1ELI5_ASPOF|nr:uncharacterized protein A4U43_C06F10390 [Asparagus officinalis]
MGDILIAIVCMPPASGVSATEIKSNMNKGPSFGNVRNGNRLKVSLKENLPERVQYSRSDGIAVIIGLLDERVFFMAYMFSLVSDQPNLIDQKDCARHRARIVALFLSEGDKRDPQD